MYYDAMDVPSWWETWETRIGRMTDDELYNYIIEERIEIYNEKIVYHKEDGLGSGLILPKVRRLEIGNKYGQKTLDRFSALIRDKEINKILKY